MRIVFRVKFRAVQNIRIKGRRFSFRCEFNGNCVALYSVDVSCISGNRVLSEIQICVRKRNIKTSVSLDSLFFATVNFVCYRSDSVIISCDSAKIIRIRLAGQSFACSRIFNVQIRLVQILIQRDALFDRNSVSESIDSDYFNLA